MTPKQEAALRLADELEYDHNMSYASASMWQAAAELRRLHELNAELLEFAENYLEWIKPLLKDIGMQEMESKARAAIARAEGEQK